MKITFNNKTVEVKQHPEDKTLYCLNDVFKASGAAENKKPSKFTRNKARDKFVPCFTKGKNLTYANEKTVYKYAAWIDDDFYDAVFDCFKAAANGQSLEASLIANTVAIPEALIAETKKVELRMKELVANAAVNGLINMKGHEVSNFSKLAQRATAGYASKELTGGRSTFMSHLVASDHKAALSAYKATLELMVMLMLAGVYDYHVIASALKVETSKNKEVFELAVAA
ncbi:hypothetical protein [Endozoicomonas sp. SESOKO1]|uniref:hypothetical protein n=1 Tax=Endozoicomonas sp. SESOKO1 TaxID=2828742 RepID=UPI002147E680|nr:hypothetical protein [Endozoicomonas sp. SESOKO1]